MRNTKEFSDEELELIKKYYPEKDGVKKLVELTGRTRQSIHSKGRRMGLSCFGERNPNNNMTSAERQKAYEERTGYSKNNTTMIGIKCVNKTDADILEKLDSVPNKAGYIKALIRADIEKNGI